MLYVSRKLLKVDEREKKGWGDHGRVLIAMVLSSHQPDGCVGKKQVKPLVGIEAPTGICL